MAKPTRTAEQLRELLLERLKEIPDLRGEGTDAYRGGVIWMDPDGGFSNWTMRLMPDGGEHRSDILQAIRTLQGQFDLED